MYSRTLCRLAQLAALVVGTLTAPPQRDERGLSQSTENAVLLAGAVVIAGLVIAAVRAYVTSHMPS
ncbi:hypothetical protein SAMN05443377_12315 [Propionibacterium cyclohexanicum]|uniref:Uncharacterized protein n=2 Tax=Propionibacterium cyclohexanicum TaxID=64702 RepID=A0A1H9TH58_9ACTN|nr:hypothetical protein SAMN05443377_12315 [Propionibacterium cyclohexanicum]